MTVLRIDKIRFSMIMKRQIEEFKKYDVLALQISEDELKKFIRQDKVFQKIYEYFLVEGKQIILVPIKEKTKEKTLHLTEKIIQRFFQLDPKKENVNILLIYDFPNE